MVHIYMYHYTVKDLLVKSLKYLILMSACFCMTASQSMKNLVVAEKIP